MDAVVKMMVVVAVVMLVPLEHIVMREDKVLKWLAKKMLQVGIAVHSMVVDLVAERIVIDYLGRRHCLLALFMDLSKGKGKGKYVCAAPP
jgi:hypothetical protein